MAIVDDRGRLFGRFNLVDVALAVLLFGLIPIAYGAYSLFRVPMPALSGVEPSSIQFAQEFRITVVGQNLRPYMRVSLNDMQGRAFLFKDAAHSEVVFGGVPPGQYDVVLYDFAQERSRLLKGLTVTPPPLPKTRVDLVGFLTGITRDMFATLRVGSTLGGIAEIRSMSAPAFGVARIMSGSSTLEIPLDESVRIPMVLRVACDVQPGDGGLGQCRAGPALGPGVYLLLDIPGRQLPFLISEVRPATAPTLITVAVKLVGDPAADPLIQSGDVDYGAAQNPATNGAVTLTRVGPERTLTLRVPAFPTLSSWMYMTQPLRVGGPLSFVTTRYQVTGTIQSLPPLPASETR